MPLDWRPAIAAEAAELRQGFGANPKIAAAIERLTNDKRMERVWGELLKRDRNTGGFLHPARPFAGSPNGEDLQILAIRAVFCVAAIQVGGALESLTRSELDQRCEPLVELERRFRQDADDAEKLDLGTEADRQALKRLADECAWRLQSYRGLFPTARRHRSDGRVVGYVTGLVPEFEKIFGKPMIGTLATITEVALGLNGKVSKTLVQRLVDTTSDP